MSDCVAIDSQAPATGLPVHEGMSCIYYFFYSDVSLKHRTFRAPASAAVPTSTFCNCYSVCACRDYLLQDKTFREPVLQYVIWIFQISYFQSSCLNEILCSESPDVF